MKILCPTCGGKGRIPDPKIGNGTTMCYYNPNTGDSFPHINCETCRTSGWVDTNDVGFNSNMRNFVTTPTCQRK